MTTYIYTERNGIYIIDLQKTVKKLEEEKNIKFTQSVFMSDEARTPLYTVYSKSSV